MNTEDIRKKELETGYKYKEIYYRINDSKIEEFKMEFNYRDMISIKRGNVHHSLSDVSFELKKREVYISLKEYSKSFKVGTNNFAMFYDSLLHDISYYITKDEYHPVLYFESEEIMIEAINDIGIVNILRYYLNVPICEIERWRLNECD